MLRYIFNLCNGFCIICFLKLPFWTVHYAKKFVRFAALDSVISTIFLWQLRAQMRGMGVRRYQVLSINPTQIYLHTAFQFSVLVSWNSAQISLFASSTNQNITKLSYYWQGQFKFQLPYENITQHTFIIILPKWSYQNKILNALFHPNLKFKLE